MNNNIKISFILSVCLLACTMPVNAQVIGATNYFDSNWMETPKEKAFYYTKVTKEDAGYKLSAYWAASNKIYKLGFFADTSFRKPVGKAIVYYDNGNIKDSTVYTNNVQTIYHFNEDGKLAVLAHYDKVGDKMMGQNYDIEGKLIPGTFIYLEQAKFPGGAEAWQEYLTKHLRAKAVVKHKAPAGVYTVVVVFLVDTNGKISEVTAANDPGYGSAEEAVRVIKDGPDWIPAQQLGKKVVFRQKQTISFSISEE